MIRVGKMTLSSHGSIDTPSNIGSPGLTKPVSVFLLTETGNLLVTEANFMLVK